MKVRPSHRRTAVVFLCGALLLFLTRLLNTSLSPWGISCWSAGLLVTFPALRLAPQQGFNASVLLGLLVDSTSPLPFGCNAFLFGIAHLVIVRIRSRFAASEPLLGLVVALITNLAFYVVITALGLGRTGGATVSGLRLLTDLIASQALIGVLCYWFLALQERALAIARIGLQDEPAGANS